MFKFDRRSFIAISVTAVFVLGPAAFAQASMSLSSLSRPAWRKSRGPAAQLTVVKCVVTPTLRHLDMGPSNQFS